MRRPLYDQLAPYYELIEDRDWRREVKLIVSILKEHGSHSVVDLGCGTGYHVRALAKLGLNAIGVDISEPNIHLARIKAKEENVHPKLVIGSYYDYRPHEKVDAALCLNWSIPTREDELRRFLLNTQTMLDAEGILILDYERTSEIVWEEVGKPIVNSWNVDELTIVRVSVGQLASNVLYSRDVYLLYPERKDAKAPDEVTRYRADLRPDSVKVYVDSSYVRFFSVPELRRCAKQSGFQLIRNYVLPRNRYKRNYAVLKKFTRN
jgi:SAM-dependent methyltransferase